MTTHAFTAAEDPVDSDDPPAPTVPLPTGLANVIAVVSVMAALLLVYSIAASETSWADALANHDLHNIDLAAVLGALILHRRPGHVIGWVLVAAGAFESVALLSRAYRFFGLAGATGLADRLEGLWVPGIACLVIALPQLFPDGRLLSPWWRPLAWYGLAATVLLLTMFLVDPIGSASPGSSWWYEVPFPLFGAAVVASLLPLALRFRRSRGAQRQQFKWVFYGMAISLPMLAFGSATNDSATIVGGDSTTSILTLLALGIIPAAITVAVLRYRLYDIDIVINKSLVFVVLAAFITAVYAAIVVGLGRLLPIGEGNLGLAIAATALVAVAFEPVRVRVQHWANRLVYGNRATPYEALAAMTARIGEAADPAAVLTEAARLLAEGTGAAQAVVWVVREGYLVPRGIAGEAVSDPQPVPLPGAGLAELPGNDLVRDVRHEGQLVGALSLRKRPGEGVSSADRRLVEELAGQAALLLANTRLRSRLTERLRELRASRQRMLAAQDEARHALDRDLHDGAQQELVALKIKLGLVGTIAAREGAPGLAAGLTQIAAIADQAVETLRDVARGIYPPLLESEGLAAALSAQARRADLAVTVLDRAGRRYPRDLEATAYFCAVEALQNAMRHAHAHNAHIELNGTEETLTVAVTDDGAGFDVDATIHGSGLTHMTDRADSAGGTLTVSSRPGHGTTITLALPTTTESTTATVPNNATAPALAGATS